MSKRKMNHVCTLKEKIDQHLPKIKKNTKLWMRYQLFQARHQLLFENQNGLDSLFDDLYGLELFAIGKIYNYHIITFDGSH